MRDRNLSILVADDQECMRLLFTRVLRSMGYACDTAEDGRDCLLKFTQRDYDVVFLDLVMPEIDGETVLRWLRSQHPTTHVIVTSIQDDEFAIQNVLRLGAAAYIIKPFTAQEIQSVMRTLENRRTADGLSMVAVSA